MADDLKPIKYFMDAVQFKIIHNLESISAKDWNRLVQNNNPFLKYEFLAALERNQCLGETVGWYPSHCIAKNSDGDLIAAIPAYIKTNSFGEFVFDWSWASAYERAGLDYYPKLVVAVPFTPATGQRLLVRCDHQDSDIRSRLQQHLLDFAQSQQFSGLHWLFPNKHEMDFLTSHAYLPRLAYQYHWINNNYQNFEHFLADFKSRKRKKVNRERDHIKDANIEIVVKHGSELSKNEWHDAFQFYKSTFVKKANYPSLTENFFLEIGKSMGEQIVVIFARHLAENIACAINFKSENTLYGRYWGSKQDFNSLHFDVCFYQGIEYCIKHGLQRFEPGAQGEHKITRGFLPTEVWSAHWIAEPQCRAAIQQFLQQETSVMQEYKIELDAMSPFRDALNSAE